MNKEFNDNNYQDPPHNEGQQNNIAQQRTDGTNNPPELERAGKAQDGNNQQRSSQQGTGTTKTESDQANEMEDEGIRGGNSSI